MIYLVMGPPGSGKGTLIAAAMKELGNSVHIPIGDIARKLVQEDSPLVSRCKEIILSNGDEKGLFATIETLVLGQLEQNLIQGKNVFLDGFPKTKQQCIKLDQLTAKHNLQERVCWVLLEVNPDAAFARISNRMTCIKCNAIYNALLGPIPVQCICGGVITKPADFDEQGEQQRIKGYKDKMQEVMDHIDGRLVTSLNAKGLPEDCLTQFLSIHRSFVEAHRQIVDTKRTASLTWVTCIAIAVIAYLGAQFLD